jgi:putative transposase
MLVNIGRSALRYKSTRRDEQPLRQRIKELAVSRVRYGSERIYMLLRREGWPDNHKRVRRIYREEGLNLRSKRPHRSKAAANRLDRQEVSNLGQCWSMDFVHDHLFNSRKLRALTIVDNFSRYCYAIEVKTSFKGIDVAEVMESLKMKYGITPKRIQVDNGSEFTSKDFDRWAQTNNVTLDFSRPGKPTDNPFIESFNGSFRDECLNTSWFLSMEDAAKKIEVWRLDYNCFRPHSSLNGKTPEEVMTKYQTMPENSNLKLIGKWG